MKKLAILLSATMVLLMTGCSNDSVMDSIDKSTVIKSINNQLYENCDIIIDEYNFDYQLLKQVKGEFINIDSKGKVDKGFENIIALKAVRNAGSSNEVNDYYVNFDLEKGLIEAINSESNFIKKCR